VIGSARAIVNIFDSHAASEQGHCKKETHNENRQEHEDPRHLLETSVAQTLKYRRTNYTNTNPPHDCAEFAHNHMIQGAGNRYQQNKMGWLT
jgi:hypothetical protein